MSPSFDGTRIVPITATLSPLIIPASPIKQMCPGQWPGVSITFHETEQPSPSS